MKSSCRRLTPSQNRNPTALRSARSAKHWLLSGFFIEFWHKTKYGVEAELVRSIADLSAGTPWFLGKSVAVKNITNYCRIGNIIYKIILFFFTKCYFFSQGKNRRGRQSAELTGEGGWEIFFSESLQPLVRIKKKISRGAGNKEKIRGIIRSTPLSPLLWVLLIMTDIFSTLPAGQGGVGGRPLALHTGVLKYRRGVRTPLREVGRIQIKEKSGFALLL